MNENEKSIPNHALTGDSSSGCTTTSDSSRVMAGNYGFVYVAPGVTKKLREYLGRKKWVTVGAVSLVVKPGGQYLQVCDHKFKRLELVPLADVVDL